MIGERLSDLRKDKGLTQEELANILNLTKHNISAYERDYNEAPDSVKIAIAKYFNVSVDYLLGLTNCPNPYEKPGSRIPASKELPPDIQCMCDYLIRMLAFATASNPELVSHKLEETARHILALRENNSDSSPKS